MSTTEVRQRAKAERMRRVKEDPSILDGKHGRPSTYDYWGCKCPVCTLGNTLRCQGLRADRREREPPEQPMPNRRVALPSQHRELELTSSRVATIRALLAELTPGQSVADIHRRIVGVEVHPKTVRKILWKFTELGWLEAAFNPAASNGWVHYTVTPEGKQQGEAVLKRVGAWED